MKFFIRKNTAVPSTSNEVVNTNPSTSNATQAPIFAMDDSMPSDISCKGQAKNVNNFSGQHFPKQNDGRSFQPRWLDKYEWIEYSLLKDRVFCYPCRQFGIGFANDVFCTTGYCNWKQALTPGKGFHKHNGSVFHINSTLSWK